MTYSNPRYVHLAILALILILQVFTAQTPAAEPIAPAAAAQNMHLRLKDASFATGHVIASPLPNTIGWQCDGFVEPFTFDVRAISSIGMQRTSDAPTPAPKDTQFFELRDGAMVAGKLLDVDDEWVSVRTALLGDVKIARARVLSLVDAAYAGTLVYSGPNDNRDWKMSENQEDFWAFEGGALVSARQGAATIGHVNLPAKSQIALTLSWEGSPDFVLSLGTKAGAASNPTDAPLAAARLEVWDKQLALVREVGDIADIELLAELSPAIPRIDLTVYLDQKAGVVVVCDGHGRPLDRMTLPNENSEVNPYVQLVNHGPKIALERFEVREWDGLTTIGGTGSGIVLGESKEVLDATIVGFDAEAGELQLLTSSGQPQSLPIGEIRRGDFAMKGGQPGQNLPPSVKQPPQLGENDQTPPDSPKSGDQAEDPLAQEAISIFDSLNPAPPEPTEEITEPARVEIVWHDRTRLKGLWLPAQDGKLQFKAEEFAEPFLFEPQLLRGIIGTDERFAPKLGDQRSGTIKIGETQLAGYLEATTPADVAGPLAWHPHSSRTPSSVAESAEGAIIYRKPLPKVTASEQKPRQPDAIAAPMVQLFLGGRAPARNPDATKPTDASASRANPNDEREIVFRSGDAIDGVIQRIDESGIQFQSSETKTTVATHAQMQSAWLNRQRREIEMSPEKLQRLMTVPRSMKKDPPTHLFVSVLGDCLRGRLIGMDDEKVTAEVRLEIIELPRDQVAQIVWLHDRDWNEKEQSANSNQDVQNKAAPETNPDANLPDANGAGVSAETFRVHAIKSTDRGLTFAPETIKDGVLSGTSELLGGCAVDLVSLNQLLFGKNIANQLREYNEDPWVLSLAQYPRVFLEEEAGGGAPAGSASPMVGQLATDFGLKTLDGESFRLSKARDRIVVLDFWASWCGPCIQTMPLVEEVVAELGADKVHLVAVNIQEAPAKVQAAVDRLGLTATVLLDRDGEAAAAYAANAIPQTVIIDRDGIVTHVFVGGGAKFVQQFRTALNQLLDPPAE
ncbi:MAG: TlpA disulfide reductase family protein [Pirellulaceae bacterium]